MRKLSYRILIALKHPGYEWDEPVYKEVGESAMHGVPTAKTEYYRKPEPYLYHPPFYFYLLAGWFRVFGAGVVQARLLSAISSLLLLVLLYMLLRPMLGSWGLAVVLLLSVDAWMVFTNRVSWIENSMMPIGVVAILLYRKALTSTKPTRLFLLSGVVFGVVTAYKHIGVYFALVPCVTLLLLRRQWRQHMQVALGFLAVMAVYVGAMAVMFGSHFWHQFDVQLNRSTGSQASRGTITSISDVIRPLTEQYAIYWMTLLLMLIATLLAFGRVFVVVRCRQQVAADEAILLAWVWAAVVFFAILQLKMPHYFMMLEVPFYCYIGWEVKRRNPRLDVPRTRMIAIACTVIVLFANGWALSVRMHTGDGNPLAQTASWTAQNLPTNAKVVTEESVGSIIQQPYCKMVFARYCSDAQYIITYKSATQKVPDSRSVQVMLEGAVQLASFRGFKEVITIYRIE